MLVNKKTPIIYTKSYVKFCGICLKQAESRIDTPQTHPGKNTNEGEMNPNTGECGSKRDQINGNHAYFWSYFFEHTILFKTQEGKQMFPPFLASFSLLFYHLGGDFCMAV